MRIRVLFLMASLFAIAPFASATYSNTPCGEGTVACKHIVVLIMENRSFDELFGQFPGVSAGLTPGGLACNGTAGCCGGTVAYNPTSQTWTCTAGAGTASQLPVVPGVPTVLDADCNHDWHSLWTDWNNGSMNKFNADCITTSDWAKEYGQLCAGSSVPSTNGQYCSTAGASCGTGGTCTQTLPFLWPLAATYALSDHYFVSVNTASYPNHMYIVSLTSNENATNPNMGGKSPWTCDATHTGTGTTGTACSQHPATSCTKDSDCPNAASGEGCTNGNVYSGSFPGVDLLSASPTGNWMNPGVCFNHRTIGCNRVGYQGPSTTAALAIPNGTASTSGSTVSRATGTSFTSGMVGETMLLANVNYTVTHFTNSSTVTVSPTPPALSGASWEVSAEDALCTAQTDTCDDTQFLAASRGSACPNVTTIIDTLTTAGVSSGVYSGRGNGSNVNQQWNPPGYIEHLRYGTYWTNHVFPNSQFASDAAASTSAASDILPSVSWIIPTGAQSMHPGGVAGAGQGTVQAGEAFIQTEVQAITQNPYLFANTIMFIVWDDPGGKADHVAPTEDTFDWTTGMRVPMIMVGQTVKQGYINTTTTFTPASMLKCIEGNFGVANLNTLDLNANDPCTSTLASPAGMIGPPPPPSPSSNAPAPSMFAEAK